MLNKFTYRNFPDKNGKFGDYGGRFVAETLMPLILNLEKQYNRYKNDPKFVKEFESLSKNFIGRPSPLYFAKNLTKFLGGAKIYFKRAAFFMSVSSPCRMEGFAPMASGT